MLYADFIRVTLPTGLQSGNHSKLQNRGRMAGVSAPPLPEARPSPLAAGEPCAWDRIIGRVDLDDLRFTADDRGRYDLGVRS